MMTQEQEIELHKVTYDYVASGKTLQKFIKDMYALVEIKMITVQGLISEYTMQKENFERSLY